MTLNQILYFHTLAEIGHMGQAAEQLFISQPSLSVAIARLEEELGIRLFARKGHRLSLTAEGLAYLAHAKKILREVEESKTHMARLAGRQEKKIRLGCTTPLLREYFPQKMRSFLQVPGNEDISFEFSIENTGELIRRLKNGLYDLLLCSGSDDPELVQTCILSEPIGLILPEGEVHPPVTWQELSARPLIGYEENSVTDKKLREIEKILHVEFHFSYRAPTEDAIASLVEHGLGWAIIPWSDSLLTSYRIAQYPLPDGSAFTRDLFLTTLQGQEQQGAAARFIKFIL